MVEEGRTVEYTDIQSQFLKLLEKYPVKAPETIVDYITSQGETALEDPERLAQSLSECEISPVRRRQILKHWFADKGVEVPEHILKKATLPPERRKEAEEIEAAERARRESKYSVDEDTGSIKVATTSEKALSWEEAQKLSKEIKKEIEERGKGKEVKYVYDTETNQVRMAKGGELGGTLEQAKELKKMAEEGSKGAGESPFIQDAEGNWQLNPKARVTGVELMALESIRKAHERGEPVDPLDALAESAERMRVYKEALGGGERQLPAWMTDPVQFIQTIRTISPEPKADEGAKEEIAEMRRTIEGLKEDKYQERIATQEQHIHTLTSKVSELIDKVNDLSKPRTGMTEMDILHDVATRGISLVETELPGLRKDIKEAVRGVTLPPAKTTEERTERKRKYGKALETDEKIEELGRSIFFEER